MFQHTAARRRLSDGTSTTDDTDVSTHSRPKAAGSVASLRAAWFRSFNTQPPEGGWIKSRCQSMKHWRFQHTAARRRLFSTGQSGYAHGCFNTQPPEGGWVDIKLLAQCFIVSTHSRPKAAVLFVEITDCLNKFQHTAARRRLLMSRCPNAAQESFNTQPPEGGCDIAEVMRCDPMVSTHSRPKAAGHLINDRTFRQCFNTQPPEGGWASLKSLAPSGFAALISLSSQEKREREYNTAFSVTPEFAIS